MVYLTSASNYLNLHQLIIWIMGAIGKEPWSRGCWASGCSAMFVLFVTVILMFPIGEAITVGGGIGKVEVILLIIYYLVLTVSCFFIVKKNPKSYWYVPLICNALTVYGAFTDSSFWKDSLWILFGGGLVLSIIASIIGARKGRKVAISHNP